jgi:AcrR family transcriptional regulator
MRELILDTARTCFAERGFEGATIREIAARAGVNPALVLYYFGSKQRLFVGAMQLPQEVTSALPRLLSGPAEGVGERVMNTVLDLWEVPEIRALLVGLVRSATTDPLAAAMLRQLFVEGPLLTATQVLDRPDAALRGLLVGSHLMGLALGRYVLEVEPLASAPRAALVRAMGPTLQRYLTGDLFGSGA